MESGIPGALTVWIMRTWRSARSSFPPVEDALRITGHINAGLAEEVVVALTGLLHFQAITPTTCQSEILLARLTRVLVLQCVVVRTKSMVEDRAQRLFPLTGPV